MNPRPPIPLPAELTEGDEREARANLEAFFTILNEWDTEAAVASPADEPKVAETQAVGKATPSGLSF